ncbi:MAG: tRNA (adenosine(37)-N6)-threonylcarbamoyltransferase complex ATPase subunit type 1 TsaE [Flavobacteriaceae bacterium]
MEKIYSLSEIETVAVNLLPHLTSKVILVNGEMGAGKTTIIKALCKALNSPDVVSSPTFSLINEYRTAHDKPLYHFDGYRIENEEEAYDCGADEYLPSGDVCVIEWSENIASLLPEESNSLMIEKIDATTRKITLL